MIKIICVGSIKERSMRELIGEYKKRISKYTKIEIIEVNDINNGEISKNVLKESKEIKKHIVDKDYLITLEIGGHSLDSIDFSKKIEKELINSSNITFIIGGSNGIDDSIKKMSNYSLSFSDMTFPHQLFRLMLLEQIYRSFKIINNETYHK